MGMLGRLFQKGKRNTARCSAVVPAAGSSRRMGEDKLLFPLDGVPVIVLTLRALERNANIQEIILVTREDLIVPLGQLCKDARLDKVRKIVVGGETRTDSVLAGIREVDPAAELIAIHDGARPFVTDDIIDAAVKAALEHGAAAPAVPVKDTIKQAADGVVTCTPDRAQLFAVQTPQVFEHGLILGALEKAKADGAELTDDCAAVERLGMPVRLTQGSYENMKLTTPDDLTAAQAILDRRGSV